jgi:hypothetical protein
MDRREYSISSKTPQTQALVGVRNHQAGVANKVNECSSLGGGHIVAAMRQRGIGSNGGENAGLAGFQRMAKLCRN